MKRLTDKELALAEKYVPVFMLDEKEPFTIDALGVTIFYRTEKSDSFPKRIIYVEDSIFCVIEYAVWFDYDIQHLYELEHVWVYVGNDMRVIKAEGSFHGKYLNIVDLDTGELDVNQEGHVIVYMQPGKHAVLSDARLVKLVPEWRESCMEKAGIDGLLIQDMFRDRIKADEAIQQKVKAYIKDFYAFEPSLRFIPFYPTSRQLMSWEALKDSIPERISKQLAVIMR